MDNPRPPMDFVVLFSYIIDPDNIFLDFPSALPCPPVLSRRPAVVRVTCSRPSPPPYRVSARSPALNIPNILYTSSLYCYALVVVPLLVIYLVDTL